MHRIHRQLYQYIVFKLMFEHQTYTKSVNLICNELLGFELRVVCCYVLNQQIELNTDDRNKHVKRNGV